MALTIITPAEAALANAWQTANSFVTLAEMTAYCETRLGGSVWNAATQASWVWLTEATRDISNARWASGQRTDNRQSLQWPRMFAIDPDFNFDGTPGSMVFDVLLQSAPNYYASDVVPQRVKDATCELAFQYGKNGDISVVDVQAAGVVEETIGPLTTKWEHGKVTGMARYPRVLSLLGPLVKRPSANVPMRRV